MTKRKHKVSPHPPKIKDVGGRPTKLTEDVLLKLKAAFSNYANIEEACFHAGISVSTFFYNAPKGSELYDYLLSFRMGPKILAKKTVMAKLTDTDMAWKFLKNTAPGEFAEKLIHEDTGPKKGRTLSERAEELAQPYKNAQAQTSNQKNSGKKAR